MNGLFFCLLRKNSLKYKYFKQIKLLLILKHGSLFQKYFFMNKNSLFPNFASYPFIYSPKDVDNDEINYLTYPKLDITKFDTIVELDMCFMCLS